MMGGCDI
jgi:hypothetical protein